MKKSFISACQTATKKTPDVIKNLINFDDLLKNWILDPTLMVDFENHIISLKSVEKGKFIFKFNMFKNYLLKYFLFLDQRLFFKRDLRERNGSHRQLVTPNFSSISSTASLSNAPSFINDGALDNDTTYKPPPTSSTTSTPTTSASKTAAPSTAVPTTSAPTTSEPTAEKIKLTRSKKRRMRYNTRNEQYNQNCRNLLEFYKENTDELNLARCEVKTDDDSDDDKNQKQK